MLFFYDFLVIWFSTGILEFEIDSLVGENERDVRWNSIETTISYMFYPVLSKYKKKNEKNNLSCCSEMFATGIEPTAVGESLKGRGKQAQVI